METQTTPVLPGMSVTIHIPHSRRSDILCNAIEGGSNYWYYLSDNAVNVIRKATPDMAGEPLVERMWKAIELGNTIEVHDLENKKEKIGQINLDSIRKGEELMSKICPEHFADWIGENDDAITGDVWFQFCSLGELIYG